jgi:predicted AAA+ superfamily ATPase
MVKIAEIVNQNPWWSRAEEFATFDFHLSKAKPIFFKRKELSLEKGNIYILRGCRQIGKTTYLKNLVRKLIEKGIPPLHILYLSLDFFTSRREMRNALNYFFDSTREANEIYIFLDEITSLEDWNLELKYLADSGIAKNCVIVATGSSALRLKEKGELLPGRGLEGNEYYIKPLSFREFVLQTVDFISKHIETEEFRDSLIKLSSIITNYSINLDSKLEEISKDILNILAYKKELQYLFRIYLITGGIPGVVNHYLQNRYGNQKEIISSSLSEIFIRDVLGDLSRLQRQETVIRDILKAVTEKYGSRYSFSKLSQGIGRTHVTVIDSLEVLENSFILIVLYAYDFNENYVKSKGHKKVYFLDPFIFCSIKSYLSGMEIWNIITETLRDEEMQSKLVEGIVISHLLMHKEIPYLRESKTFLWNYYDKSGREIDSVVKVKKKYLGIEIKYRAQVDERDIKKISPIKDYILLSKENVGEKGNVLIIPVDVFLSLLTV